MRMMVSYREYLRKDALKAEVKSVMRMWGKALIGPTHSVMEQEPLKPHTSTSQLVPGLHLEKTSTLLHLQKKTRLRSLSFKDSHYGAQPSNFSNSSDCNSKHNLSNPVTFALERVFETPVA